MRQAFGRRTIVVAACIGLVTAMRARTGSLPMDLNGVYDLQLLLRGDDPAAPATAVAAATLTQQGDAFAGTVRLDMLPAPLAGPYELTGHVTGHRVRLSGRSDDGAQLAWRGYAWQGITVDDGMSGPLRVRRGRDRAVGRLTFLNERGPSNGSTSTTSATTTSVAPTTTVAATTSTQAATTTLFATTTTLGGTTLPTTTTATSAPTTTVASTTTASSTSTTTLDPYRANCAVCHGVDGGGGVGPDIRCSVPSRIADAVRRGRGNGVTMPVFAAGTLSAGDLATVERLLAGWCNDSGSELYYGNCGTCHGLTARGGRNADGVRGPDIHCSNAGDVASAIAEGPDAMPSFPELSNGQIGHIAYWIRGFCGGPTSTVITTTTTTSTTTTTTTTTTTATTLAGSTTTTSSTTTTTAPHFAAAVQPIFSASCAIAFCHGSTGPAQGLDLSAGHAYAAIVDVASTEVPASKRVAPGNPAASYLYEKVTNAPGILGAAMPTVPLSNGELQTIAAWIAAGAPND